jgi:8-oxo-dGTP pyrophosphatase MutT (NUDIX family)
MDLKNIIENFKPYNEQEQKDKETFLKWMDSFEDLLTRNNEFAHFTSSAFVVNKEKTKVLMIYHKIYDSWGWTGGHADGEDDLLSVALREVEEETGVKKLKPVSNDIFLLDILSVIGHFKRGKYVSAHVHLSVAYLIEADENEPLRIKEDENSGVAWVPIGEVVAKSTEPHMKILYKKAIDKIQSFSEV